jgi:hypothetical protein
MLLLNIRHLLCLCLLVLGGCAISPQSEEGKQLHESMWQAQRERNAQVLQQNPRPSRLLVLAVGLSDETKAFPGDVIGTVQGVRAIRPDALVWQMWNAPAGEKLAAPFATREALTRAVAEMREAARPGDRMLVMITSHGHKDLLSHVIANRVYPPLRGAQLRELLQPLAEWETGVIVSACFSGSLIPVLQQPRRWIMTAAAADRSSYGCQFHGKQTYFIQGLLGALAGPEMGLDAWYRLAAERIQQGEDQARLTPSLPQLWVGPELQAYRQSLKNFWLP